jgi:thiol-disulfide isomerase/thioredoxin
MTPIRNVLWLFAAALVLAAGCESEPPTSIREGGVELRPVNAAELEQVIQGQRGRVVLVDFWATWCGPCRGLFPHTVALRKQYEAQGLSVVTVSLDNVGNMGDVHRFLLQHDAGELNFIAHDDGSRSSFKRFGLGSRIPFLAVYDRKGQLRNTIPGPDEAGIDRAVRDLLDEK